MHKLFVQAHDDHAGAGVDTETVVEGQPLMFVLEHTTQPIVSIACSAEQQLVMAADAAGAVSAVKTAAFMRLDYASQQKRCILVGMIF